MSSLIGTLIRRRFLVVEALSDEGTFGETFLAEDTHGKRKRKVFVLKRFKKEKMDPSLLQEMEERFDREADILESLSEVHDQIPKFEAFLAPEEGEEEMFIVMEYIEGTTLERKIRAEEQLDEAAVREILISLLHVLEFVHSTGLIHRDIKPANIILRERDSKPVLIDFGIVKAIKEMKVDSRGRRLHGTRGLGTEGYMAPEQADSGPCFASDIFSLGRTAIYLLTKLSPSELRELDEVNPLTGEIQWRKYTRGVDPSFAEVIDKAIWLSPLQRYQTASEMLAALEALPTKEKITTAKQSEFASSGSMPQADDTDDNRPGILPQMKPLTPTIEEPVGEKLLASIPPEFTNITDYEFSTRGRQVMFVADKGDKRIAQVGQKVGPEFDHINFPILSEDGRRAAYVASSDDDQECKEFVVVDDEIGPAYDDVGYPVFSPDGSKICYPAQNYGGKKFLVVNGKEGRGFDDVDERVFSQDGSRLAYCAELDGKAILIVDDELGPEYDRVPSIIFSPDGKTLAYIAEEGDETFVVFGSNKSRKFYDVWSLVFSPDGSKVGYAVRGRETGKAFVVWGEKSGPLFDGIYGLIFSPDGSKVAYCAKLDGKEFAVINNKLGPEFDEVSQLVFSPDGKTLGYAAKFNNKWFFVVGDKAGPELDRIMHDPVFSPDGSKVAYITFEGQEIWLRVWDFTSLEPIDQKKQRLLPGAAFQEGTVVKGTVVGIEKGNVIVDFGYKVQGFIDQDELEYSGDKHDTAVINNPKVGSEIEVYIKTLGSEGSPPELSRLRALFSAAWCAFESAYAKNRSIEVIATERDSEGLIVKVDDVVARLPITELTLYQVHDLNSYLDTKLEVQVVEFSYEEPIVVLSRKAALFAEQRIQQASKPQVAVATVNKHGSDIDDEQPSGLDFQQMLDQYVASETQELNDGLASRAELAGSFWGAGHTKLFVANLTYSTTDEELRELFSQVGTVEEAAVTVDYRTGRSRGFGHVRMSTVYEFKLAIERINGLVFKGRKLFVEEYRSRNVNSNREPRW